MPIKQFLKKWKSNPGLSQMPPDRYIKHFFLLTFWALYVERIYTFQFLKTRKLCSLLNSHRPGTEGFFRHRTGVLFLQRKFCTIPRVWELWAFPSCSLGAPLWDRRAWCGCWGRCGDRSDHRGDNTARGSFSLNSCTWEGKFQTWKESRKCISDRESQFYQTFAVFVISFDSYKD